MGRGFAFLVFLFFFVVFLLGFLRTYFPGFAFLVIFYFGPY